MDAHYLLRRCLFHRVRNGYVVLPRGLSLLGANDVSNSFATAVGSKALTMKQACVIAVFMEFSGSFLLGGNVASTIMKGITEPKYFADEPVGLAAPFSHP